MVVSDTLTISACSFFFSRTTSRTFFSTFWKNFGVVTSMLGRVKSSSDFFPCLSKLCHMYAMVFPKLESRETNDIKFIIIAAEFCTISDPKLHRYFEATYFRMFFLFYSILIHNNSLRVSIR